MVYEYRGMGAVGNQDDTELRVQNAVSISESSGKQKLNQIIIIFSHSHSTWRFCGFVPSADGTIVKHVSCLVLLKHCYS